MIELRDIRFSYPSGRKALEGVSLSVAEGDRVALHGRNGSGKSTLFHVMMGLLKPSGGTLTMFGGPREREDDFAEVRRRVGLLFQDTDDQLFCPTVAEEIAFGPMNLGKSREEALAIVQQKLELLGLEGFEQRVSYNLSGGEKRLVALASVLAMEPEVLLLDEPVSDLDEQRTAELAEFLKGSSLTYVIVSHDRDFLEETTGRSVTLREGRTA